MGPLWADKPPRRGNVAVSAKCLLVCPLGGLRPLQRKATYHHGRCALVTNARARKPRPEHIH